MTKKWKLKNNDKEETKQRLQRAEAEPGEEPAEAGASHVVREDTDTQEGGGVFPEKMRIKSTGHSLVEVETLGS